MKKKQTQSFTQTIRFFDEFIRRNEVVHFIKKYRKELGLPSDGIPFTDEDKKAFEAEILPMFYLPDRIFPLKGKSKKESGVRIINTCITFVRSQGIDSFYVKVMFRIYLIFNTRIDVPMSMFDIYDDLLKLEHLPSELSWYDSEDHYLLKCMYGHFNSVAKRYPVALYINPEASQNQVKDFISKNWHQIKVYQKTDRGTFAKLRKRKNQRRDDIIYANCDLPLARIREVISRECGEYLDDGHISKIIQIEKKRRS